jgi:hypothetical protein
MISVEKPGSPSEILEHHGVKGQKWGVQRRVTKSGGFKSLSKASQANVQGYHGRKSANTSFNKANLTSRDKASAIYQARTSSQHKHMVYATQKARTPERAAAKKAYLNDPNRAIALRTTRGEKVIFGTILAASGPLTVATLNPVPAAVGVGTLAGLGIRLAVRKRIETKQARGAYG